MPLLDWDLLHDLELVDGLEYRESLPDRVNPDVFESGMIEVDEDVAGDAVLWRKCRDQLVHGVGVAGRTHPVAGRGSEENLDR